MNTDNEIISAFAFELGQQIEDIINNEIGDVKYRNRILESKILEWYTKNRDKEFAKHFGISVAYEGIPEYFKLFNNEPTN